MAFVKKKVDPISERARVLNGQIAALEAEIKRLDAQIHRAPTPRLRSTVLPHGATVARPHEAPAPPPAPAPPGPVFEEVSREPLQAREETIPPEHFSEAGVRKYDLPALINRLRRHFRRPTSLNPRLVAYLAAGGVHGLRPMRYEKRVARNRFLLFVIVLAALLLGLFSVLLGSR